MKRRSRRLAWNHWAAGALQSHFLITSPGEVSGSVDIKWMVRLEVRERHVDVIVNRTRALLLLIGQRHLAVTNNQLSERELLLAGGRLLWRSRRRRRLRRRSGLLARGAGLSLGRRRLGSLAGLPERGESPHAACVLYQLPPGAPPRSRG